MLEKVSLRPEKVVTTDGGSVGNFPVLQIYMNFFAKGFGDQLPPVAVVDKSLIGLVSTLKESFDLWYKSLGLDKEFKETVRQGYSRSTYDVKCGEYLVLDGCHRSLASALIMDSVDVHVIRDDKDLNEYKRMEKNGLVNPWPPSHGDVSLKDLVMKADHSNYIKSPNLRDRAYAAIHRGKGRNERTELDGEIHPWTMGQIHSKYRNRRDRNKMKLF